MTVVCTGVSLEAPPALTVYCPGQSLSCIASSNIATSTQSRIRFLPGPKEW